MTTLVLYGSFTSPYVRRVRIVAAELGVEPTLVDTVSDEGRARLLATSPIAKVPAAEIDGQVVWDSANIIDTLVRLAPRAGIRPLPECALDRARTMNLLHAIDECTLSAIRLFYLRRDGVELKGPFLERERARVDDLLDHVEKAAATFDVRSEQLGRLEVALVSSLGWMRFRGLLASGRVPALEAHEAALTRFASVRDSAPR